MAENTQLAMDARYIVVVAGFFLTSLLHCIEIILYPVTSSLLTLLGPIITIPHFAILLLFTCGNRSYYLAVKLLCISHISYIQASYRTPSS